MRYFGLALLVIALGCGGGGDGTQATAPASGGAGGAAGAGGASGASGAGGGGAGTGGDAPIACPKGQVEGAQRACIPVGIQACAELFRGDDGLCHPTTAKCPAGTIPKLDEGCVPVGIQGCPAAFVDPDGVCRPRTSKCAPGTIPDLAKGCVPVGIVGCAAEFIVDGVCQPSSSKCAAGTFPVPQEGCVSIDAKQPCGQGPWGDVSDAAGNIYVDPSSTVPMPDGSKAKPFTAIDAALAVATKGGRVVLAAGTYAAGVQPKVSVEITGRCASMVTLTGATGGGPTSAAVTYIGSASDGSTLRNVTIATSTAYGVYVGSKNVTVANVHIAGALARGIDVLSPGSATFDHVLVTGTKATNGMGGLGISVTSGTATVKHSAFVNGSYCGIFATAGTVTLDDTVIEGFTAVGAGTTGGGAILAQSGTNLTVANSAIVNNKLAGIFAGIKPTKVTVTGSVIADSSPNPYEPLAGRGIDLGDTVVANITSTVVLRATRFGVFTGPSNTVTLTGSLIAGTRQIASDKDPIAGAVAVQGKTVASLLGNAIVGNGVAGIAAFDAGTTATIEGSVIEGTLPFMGDGTHGAGVQIESGSAVTFQRNAVLGNTGGAFVALGAGTSADVADSLLAETVAEPMGVKGQGIQLGVGAAGSLRRCVVENNPEVGVIVNGTGSHLVAEANLIRGSVSPDSNIFGIGVEVYQEATAELTGNAIIANGTAGIVVGSDPAFGGGAAKVTMRANLVQGTLGRADGFSGTGVLVQNAGSLDSVGDAIVENKNMGYLFGKTGASVSTVSAGLVELTGSQASNKKFGGGVNVQASALELHDMAFLHLRESAISVYLAGADVLATHVFIRDVLGQEVDDQFGMGVSVGFGASMRLEDSVVRETHLAGAVMNSPGTLTASRCLFRDVRVGKALLNDGTLSTTIGDGVIITLGASATLTGVRSIQNARAGIVFVDGTGSVSQSEATGNVIGVVATGTQKPALAQDNSFHDNAQGNVKTDGDVAVPNKPLDYPDVPTN